MRLNAVGISKTIASYSPAYTIMVGGKPRLVYVKYEYTPNRGLTIVEIREMTIVDRLVARVNFNTRLAKGTITIPKVAFGIFGLFGPIQDVKVMFDNSAREKILLIYSDR